MDIHIAFFDTSKAFSTNIRQAFVQLVYQIYSLTLLSKKKHSSQGDMYFYNW